MVKDQTLGGKASRWFESNHFSNLDKSDGNGEMSIYVQRVKDPVAKVDSAVDILSQL